MVGLALFTFSEPARSTNEILLLECWFVSRLVVFTISAKIKCDREDESFISVDPVLR